MKAELVLRERSILSESAFVEIVIWRVPTPIRGSTHEFKYRLALVSDDVCVPRYDNEAGKGDHKHVDDQEMPYTFVDSKSLQTDFRKDVENWRRKH